MSDLDLEERARERERKNKELKERVMKAEGMSTMMLSASRVTLVPYHVLLCDVGMSRCIPLLMSCSLNNPADNLKNAAAMRAVNRDETLKLQDEKQRFQESTRQRLEHEAKSAAEAEADRLQDEILKAREYERQVLSREEKRIAEHERRRLEAEQRNFIEAEGERRAAELEKVEMDAEKRRRAQQREFAASEKSRLETERQALVEREKARLSEEQSKFEEEEWKKRQEDWNSFYENEKDRLEAAAEREKREESLKQQQERRLKDQLRAKQLPAERSGQGERDLVDSVRSGAAGTGSEGEATTGRGKTPASGTTKKVLLIMTVEIGDGRSAAIKVHEGDTAQNLAEQFCVEHSLSTSIVPPLSDHIQQHVSAVIAQREAEGKQESSAPNTARAKEQKEDSPKSKTHRSSFSSQKEKDAYFARLAQKKRPSSASAEANALRATSENQTPHIDPHSRRLASARGSSSVFDRLHQNATIRRRNQEDLEVLAKNKELEELRAKPEMTWITKELTKSRNKAHYENYGVRLYQEGLLQLEQKRELQKKAAELKEKEESALVENSKKVVKTADPEEAPWVRQYQEAANRKERGTAKKEKLEKQKFSECTFKPQINGRSRKLMDVKAEMYKESKLPTHEQLFQDAERRRIRQSEYHNWYPEEHTFQPHINVQIDREEGEDEFLNRLVYSYKEQEEMLQKKREEKNKMVDESGQELFKPKTGRAPSFNRNNTTLPIGDFLFASRYEFEDIRDRLRLEEESRLKKMANQPKTQETSARIVEDMKRKRLMEIFNALDQDRDGYVTLDDVEINENAEKAVKDDLVPLMLEDGSSQYNFDSFYMLIERNWKKLQAAGPRSHFYQLNRKKKVPQPSPTAATMNQDNAEDATFHPHINPTSEELARRQRDQSGHKPVFEKLASEVERRRRNMRELEEKKKNDELKECTFAPQIDLNSRRLSRKYETRGPNTSRSDSVAARLAQPKRVEKKKTSEDLELEMHCTFEPNAKQKGTRPQSSLSNASNGYPQNNNSDIFNYYDDSSYYVSNEPPQV